MDKKYYYKAMSKDMQCRGYQFKVGETYTIESKELELCSDRVFHFCERLEDTIDYYSIFSSKHFLIEVLGDIVTEDSKSGSNKIRIVREISREEVEEHIQDKDDNNAKRFLALYTKNVKILEILYKDEEWRVRKYILSNPNTPVYILKELVKDEDWRVRCAIAEKLNTPIYILEKLAKDKNWRVRWEVAWNLNTPIYLLEYLSKDVDWTVRSVVAKQPNTPVYILEYLSKDENWKVVEEIIENPNTPIYLLEKLTKSKKEIVRKTAQGKLKEITQ